MLNEHGALDNLVLLSSTNIMFLFLAAFLS
jgi:hypothetical protein